MCICMAAGANVLRPATSWQAVQNGSCTRLSEAWRKQQRLVHGRAHVEVTQKQLAQFRRENAAQEDLLRQQRKDREARAALTVLEGGSLRSLSPLPTHQQEGAEQATDALPSHPKPGSGGEDQLIVLRRLR